MSDFVLDARLLADCHVLGRIAKIQLLLQRNAMLPWFVLVPESSALELHELEPALRRQLEGAADSLARFVKVRFACDKINVAAIGNVVSQLHLHVIGRWYDDCCWPQAPWGHVTGFRAYGDGEVGALRDALIPLLGYGSLLDIAR